MAQTKLIIPAPGYEDDARAFYLAYGVTLLIVGVMLLGLAQLVMATHIETDAERERRLDAEAVARAEERAVLLSEAITAGTFRPSDLQDRDLESALTHGRFDLAEEACLRMFARLPELSPSRRIKLINIMTDKLDERAGNMALGCLVRAWFAGDLRPYPALDAVVADVWSEVDSGALTRLSVAKMVEMYETSRDRPQDPRFYHWLRHCAMRAGNIEWPFCVRMLRQLAPDHGDDFVLMTDVHLKDAGAKKIDWRAMARALGYVGGKGQPRDWTVTTHPEMVNFAYDIRLGALYQLCRLVHVEDQDIANAAAYGLGVAALRNETPVSPIHLKRWRFTCRYAFGAPMDREMRPEKRPDPAPLPSLAPVPGDLTLAGAVSAGRCTPRTPKAPIWSCGVDAWAGDASNISEALSDLYVETRHLAWTREASNAPMPTADPSLPVP